MKQADFSRTVEGVVHLATASGLDETSMCASLLQMIYCLASRGVGRVVTREEFKAMALAVFDRCERDLHGGVKS